MTNYDIFIVCFIMILLGIAWSFSLIKVLSGKESQRGLKNFGLLAVFVGGILLCIKFLNDLEYQGSKIYPVFCLLFSTILSTTLIFVTLKKSNPDITFFSFLFNIQDAIYSYRLHQQKRISEELNIESLEKKFITLKETEADLSNKSRDIFLKQEQIEAERGILNELKNEVQCIKIPIEKNIIIDINLMSLFPMWVGRFSSFYEKINRESSRFAISIKQKKTSGTDIEYIYAYFKILCKVFCTFFFREDEGRMHFRVLIGDTYKSFVSTTHENVTLPVDFKANEGVFKYLNRERRSIVRSKNPDLFAPGSNPKWEDCLSGALDNYLNHNKQAVITFGISVKFSSPDSRLLYFLSFIRIEEFLLASVKRFEERMQQLVNNDFNIIKELKKWQR